MLDQKLFARWFWYFCRLHKQDLVAQDLQIYYQGVCDIPDEDFDAIAHQINREHEFFPKPRTFHRFREESLKSQIRPEWERAMVCASRREPLVDNGFSPQIRQAIQSIGGSSRLSMCQEKDQAKLFEEFFKEYLYLSSNRTRAAIAPTSQYQEKIEARADYGNIVRQVAEYRKSKGFTSLGESLPNG